MIFDVINRLLQIVSIISTGYISPYRATPIEDLKELCGRLSELKLIDGEWNQQVVYDLGCGDGTVNVELAATFGSRGTGLDLSEKLIFKATQHAESRGVSHLVQFKIQDLLTADLSEATIIFLFLLPDALEKLKPILQREFDLRRLLLIVEQWPMTHWEDKLVYTHNQGQFRVYTSSVSDKTS